MLRKKGKYPVKRCIGLIGSIEMNGLCILEDTSKSTVETIHGRVEVMTGRLEGTKVVQMTRGSKGLAAHAINHRANISAMIKLGVTDIIATAMVGALHSSIPIGSLFLLDQFLDFTKHTQRVYYEDEKFRDFDFTEPFCSRLRSVLVQIAKDRGIEVIPHACYIGVDGPRFETKAEIQMFAQLGGTVIGMTVVPECIMARQAGLCYEVMAGVVNAGAGLSSKLVWAKDFLEPGSQHMKKMIEMTCGLAKFLADKEDSVDDGCKCGIKDQG